MNSPVYDFVTRYIESGTSRLHMPGHKGAAHLGIEERDITEIAGADVLYEADGILAESERNASELFGTGLTVYSAEGSSLSIRAMVYLGLLRWRLQGHDGERPVLLAARNAHKVLLFSAALMDFDIEWIYPETDDISTICSCHPSAEAVEERLASMEAQPFAVYLTSPDYLGFIADIGAIAGVCDRYGLPLLVDNAHGAYTHFLAESRHPIDLGAYMCTDSAHKTLPCLTGASYLHLSRRAAEEVGAEANDAMALFGTTSPSYLILQSLDLCNVYLADGYREKFAQLTRRIDALKDRLRAAGLGIVDTEPLKVTVDAASAGMSGSELADHLRRYDIEAEFADVRYVVLMFTPDNTDEDFARLEEGLTAAAAARRTDSAGEPAPVRLVPLEQVMTVREAIFAPHEQIPVTEAAGSICGQPSVSCPPAIPIAVSGERITAEIIPVFLAYDIETVSVVRTRR